MIWSNTSKEKKVLLFRGFDPLIKTKLLKVKVLDVDSLEKS